MVDRVWPGESCPHCGAAAIVSTNADQRGPMPVYAFDGDAVRCAACRLPGQIIVPGDDEPAYVQWTEDAQQWEIAELRAENDLRVQELKRFADDRLNALEQRDALRAELIETLDSAFLALAHEETDGDKAGWFDTMARGDINAIAERLCELDVYERHADAHGRRRWYRRKSNG